MKKTHFLLSLCLLLIWQTATAQYSSWVINDITPTSCATHTLRVSHVPTQPGEAICSVELERRPVGSTDPNAWVWVQTKNPPTTGTYTDFSITQVGEYKAYVFFGWTPNPCSYGYSSITNNIATVSTIYNNASATYRVDGSTVNNSTYLQTYECQALQMTNMTLTGAGTNPAWKVDISKVGSGTTATYGWNAGALPSSYNMKTLISTTWGSLQGEYTVTLSVKNDCNPSGSSYSGKVKINANPTATTACFQISTNNSCSTFSNGGANCAGSTSVCNWSPKISGSCSGGQWLGGYFQLTVDEYNGSCALVQNIVNTPNTAIASTGDVVCLDLNVLANTPGYFFSNPAGMRYRAAWTIGNACGSTTSVRWFKDDIAGCRIAGDPYDRKEDQDQPLEDFNGFSTYPNPANTELSIMWDTNTEEQSHVRILDLNGRVLQVPIIQSSLGFQKLDISGLPKGLYMVELDNGTRTVQRVVID